MSTITCSSENVEICFAVPAYVNVTCFDQKQQCVLIYLFGTDIQRIVPLLFTMEEWNSMSINNYVIKPDIPFGHISIWIKESNKDVKPEDKPITNIEFSYGDYCHDLEIIWKLMSPALYERSIKMAQTYQDQLPKLKDRKDVEKMCNSINNNP